MPVQPIPQVQQSVGHHRTSSGTEWNVYLHHPRGTVERIGGPFADEAEARKEMSFQMSFGLFPESKGYQWECKAETEEADAGE